MGDIKPIETAYNGYRFRSRLEARWAVFFDALGIKYEYEPEGYTLQDGTKYLPDFFLPDQNYYIEVKGMSDHVFSDLEKVSKFVLEAKTVVMILSQIPYDPGAYGLFWFPYMYYEARSGGCVSQHYAFFMQVTCGDCIIQDDFYIGQNKYFSYTPYREDWLKARGQSMNQYAYNGIQPISGRALDGDERPIKEEFNVSNIEYALQKARSARFEHGETPVAHSLLKDSFPFF